MDGSSKREMRVAAQRLHEVSSRWSCFVHWTDIARTTKSIGPAMLHTCLDIIDAAIDSGMYGREYYDICPRVRYALLCLAAASGIGPRRLRGRAAPELLFAAVFGLDCGLVDGLSAFSDCDAEWIYAMLPRFLHEADDLDLPRRIIMNGRSTTMLDGVPTAEAIGFAVERMGIAPAASDPRVFGRELARSWSRIYDEGLDENVLAVFGGGVEGMVDYTRWRHLLETARDVPECTTAIGGMCMIGCDEEPVRSAVLDAMESDAGPDDSMLEPILRTCDGYLTACVPPDGFDPPSFHSLKVSMDGVDIHCRVDDIPWDPARAFHGNVRSPGIVGVLRMMDALAIAAARSPAPAGDPTRYARAHAIDAESARMMMADVMRGLPADMMAEAPYMYGRTGSRLPPYAYSHGRLER